MKKIIYITIMLLIGLILLNCNDNSPIDNDDSNQIIVSEKSLFKYELLATSPIHTQTVMLTGYQNKLYRFGSKWPVQVLELDSKNWSNIDLPDSSYWRWDGSAVTIGDMIYILATSTESNSYDILKFDVPLSKFEHTGVNLPTNFNYPAYCVYGSKILFLSMDRDSVYEYNTNINQIKAVSRKPFYSTINSNWDLFFGQKDNFLYVLGGVQHFFYRLNLDDYLWESIEVPTELENEDLFGALFGEQLILFSDNNTTYEYSLNEEKWYKDTTKTPIPLLSYDSEWSFYSDGNILYGSDIMMDKVWKITK